ncbi:MAG: hypothetical protein JRN07_04725, partial [Nitrososphaerota archaeon]|nr:hypothetical protein [Nitrososphaerota archaeon]
MWDPKADGELYRTYCPNCGDRLIGDAEKGEQQHAAGGLTEAHLRIPGDPRARRRRAPDLTAAPRTPVEASYVH